MTTTDINNWTRRDFEKLPCRKWDEDIGIFDDLVILPARITIISQGIYRLRCWLAGLLHLDRPPIYTIDGLHDSGYRCMDFIAVKDEKPICRLSRCSDVIHIEGIGGLGYDWLARYNEVRVLVPPREWNVDCLKRSGLLRLFNHRGMRVGHALSSFEIYSLGKKEK